MAIEPPVAPAASQVDEVRPLPPHALRQLLDASSAIVAVKDLAGRYIYVNQAFLALTGGEPGGYLGRTDEQIFPSAVAAQLRANDRQVLAEAREMEFEEVVESQGLQRIYRVRKYPLCDSSGASWAVCLSAQEITESRRTDQALRRVALGISAASGPEVFELTVASINAVLGVDLAFIAAIQEDGTSLATLAVCDEGTVGGSYCYQIAGTPCAEALAQGFTYYSGCAAARFPGDGMLQDKGYASYAGYPLMDSSGSVSGVLSVCHRAALPAAAMVESVLAIFAVRTAAELERMRMDQELRDSETSYRAIFEASEDCIFIHDFDTGAIVDVNARACEIYGYDRDTMLRLTPGDLSTGEPPFTQEDAARHMMRAKAGEVIRFEWHRRNADGSTAWDEVCLKRARLAGIDRILAVTRDITERKQREQALSRSEGRLRATVECALDCIITMDSGGRVREFNPAAEACFGYRRADVLGRPLADLIVPARLRRAHQDGLERYLREGDARMLGRRLQLTATRADGSEFPVELAIAEAEGVDGKLFIGYLRDVTSQWEADQARAELEARLRQAQKMEAIGHLSGGVAHDFNNILTGIMGYIGMAEEIVQADGNVRLQHYLQRARQSGARATELIQQMLTFSRGRRGEPRALAAVPLVADALRLVRASLPSSVVLAPELQKGVPAVVFDPVQFEQVLMNLCINAHDAMNRQGTLEVRLQCVESNDVVCTGCQSKTRGTFVELSVADSGPGVPAAILPRMFEPFFTTKAPGQGSGMGLATVHGIVHEHHGHIVVENRASGGAVFRVLLPPIDATAEQPVEEAAACDARHDSMPLRGRVLLVDDDEAVRVFMADLLESWGLEVIACSDPLMAHAAAQTEGPFDIAILDYTMPVMSGLELARHLQRLPQTPAMFLYSGYADGLEDDVAAAVGVRACLAKPVDAGALYHQLEAVLGLA